MTLIGRPGVCRAAVIWLISIAGCLPSIEGSHMCRTSSDCLGGRLCMEGRCAPFTPSQVDAGSDPDTTGSPGVSELYIAGFMDNLLFFMTPDVARSVRAGTTVDVVVMASNALGASAFAGEQQVIMAIFAAMAGLASFHTTCNQRAYAGKTVSVCTLDGFSSLRVTMLMLPIDHFPALWVRDFGPPFNATPEASLTTVDGASTYTRSDLISVLAAILTERAPAVVGAAYPTFTYGAVGDTQLTAAGLFELEAVHRYLAPHALRVYRGYSVFGLWFTRPAPETVNLTPAEHDEKARLLGMLNLDVSTDENWDGWCWRQYAISEVMPGNGAIAAASGPCLTRPAEVSTGDPSLFGGTCDPAGGSAWTVGSDHLVDSGGKCLTAAAGGGAVTLAACAGSPTQRWTWLANGQLLGPEAQCLTLAANGVMVGLASCGSDQSGPQFAVPSEQHWTLRPGAAGN